MLLIGKHITTPGDPLQPASVEKIYQALINTEGDVAILQRRLQAIKIIDIHQYRKLKTGLPYLVCAYFEPKIRRKENFVYTSRFIVDIDHLSEFGLNAIDLKAKLKNDSRVELMFTSPGGDGLKILFLLKDKISDSGFYALFYKTFCLQFARQYELAGAVDTKTNDVSRCCFVSHDPDAFFNPDPEKIEAAAFLPEEDSADIPFISKELNEQEKNNEALRKEATAGNQDSAPLTDEVLNQIKQKVGMRVKMPAKKEYEQPEELGHLMDEVAEQVRQVGAEVVQSLPISYGRKIKIGAGKYWAEINLFYGQKGVSIVGTSKTGSNKELCTSIVALLKSYFNVNH
ncbi:MAG: hypothetical protein J0H55_05170 [Chitinophagaceae bacterium]|nr:hypothetical protein [Chitinophagaceae bacterium]